MKIVSLFDGMACGMIALKAAGVNVEEYISCEIDKYAAETAKHNFKMIKQMGDVFNIDFSQFKNVDGILGGSPCTKWSIARTEGREKQAYGIGWELFKQYKRALDQIKPRFFLYENNSSMSEGIRSSICETFGFEQICINSSLVSAQNRKRYYWCGIRQKDGTYRKADIERPEERNIFLKDIIQSNLPDDQIYPMYKSILRMNESDSGVVAILNMKGLDIVRRVYGLEGKAPTLTTCDGGHREPKIIFKVEGNPERFDCPYYKVYDGTCEINGEQFKTTLQDGDYIVRKLTVAECKKLQQVPDWYEFPVSNRQAYKMLGNGWSCDVITHLIKSIIGQIGE